MATRTDHAKKPVDPPSSPPWLLANKQTSSLWNGTPWGLVDDVWSINTGHTFLLKSPATEQDSGLLWWMWDPELVGSGQQELGYCGVGMSRTAAKFCPLVSSPPPFNFFSGKAAGPQIKLNVMMDWIVSLKSHMLEFQPPVPLNGTVFGENL